MIISIGFGTLGYYIGLGIFGVLYSWFFYKTLRRFSSANTLAEHIKEVSINRKTFMLANSLI
jgi:hypothetical protein